MTCHGQAAPPPPPRRSSNAWSLFSPETRESRIISGNYIRKQTIICYMYGILQQICRNEIVWLVGIFFFLFKALWTKNGSCIVYPCHAIIVAIDVSSGQQQFFMGHTDKVTVTMNKCIKLVNIFFENTKFALF